MLGKFKDGLLWILPLAAHVAVHGLFTFTIAMFYTSFFAAIGLAFMDMFIHFIMDRVKASPYMLGKFKALSGDEFKYINERRNELDDEVRAMMDDSQTPPTDLLKKLGERNYFISDSASRIKGNRWFWICLGFDQMIHHLTDLLVAYIIFTH